ncbi:MAG: serine/threonine protein kinase, partial [Nannocystis sp.]
MSDTPATPRSTMIGSIDALIKHRPSPAAGQDLSEASTRELAPNESADTGRLGPARERDAGARDTASQRQSWLDVAAAGRARRGAEMVHLSPGAVIPGTRYRLLRWLGDGGMGVVYEAEHIDIERRVAVKILRLEVCDQPQALQLFRDEARAAGRIGSAHIVEILDFAELPDGRLLYTMELLRGRPLSRELAERPLSPARTIAILRQICKGLASAHAAHIIHRDIKPDNIFLEDRQSRPDIVKILDFGISIFMAGTSVTDANILGTPLYLAPEIIDGDAFDARVDMYAVGCTAFEMLTGRPPYEGTIKDLLFAHRYAPVPSLLTLTRDHDVPQALAEVVICCLAKRPDERYADMNDLEAALCEAQIAARLETAWDDLALPDVDSDRRDLMLRGMPDPAMSGAQVRSRKRTYVGAALAACLLLAGGIYVARSQTAVVVRDDPELVRLEAEARSAAARVAFVYPPADDPQGPTAYHAIRELEGLQGTNSRAARELAGSLRRQFAGTLGAFGDRLWSRPGGLEFAVDAYAQALLFDPDLEPAASRADLTPGQLARLAEKAVTRGFNATELIAVEPLVVLAESD